MNIYSTKYSKKLIGGNQELFEKINKVYKKFISASKQLIDASDNMNENEFKDLYDRVKILYRNLNSEIERYTIIMYASDEDLAKLLMQDRNINRNIASTKYKNQPQPQSLPNLEYSENMYRFPNKKETKDYILYNYSLRWIERNIKEINETEYSDSEKLMVNHILEYWQNNQEPAEGGKHEDGKNILPWKEF